MNAVDKLLELGQLTLFDLEPATSGESRPTPAATDVAENLLQGATEHARALTPGPDVAQSDVLQEARTGAAWRGFAPIDAAGQPETDDSIIRQFDAIYHAKPAQIVRSACIILAGPV